MLTPILVLNQRIAVRLRIQTRWMILMILWIPQMMTMMWLISMRRIMTTMIVYLIEVEQYWVRRRMEMVMDMDRIRMNQRRTAAQAYAENPHQQVFDEEQQMI